LGCSDQPLADCRKRRACVVEKLSMATDDSTHFPIVGKQFVEAGHVRSGNIGEADALLCSTRALVDFAEDYFCKALTCP
jgi:aminoglycoside N3'-acetyltransferase